MYFVVIGFACAVVFVFGYITSVWEEKNNCFAIDYYFMVVVWIGFLFLLLSFCGTPRTFQSTVFPSALKLIRDDYIPTFVL